MTAMTTSYLTFREASEITGLTEATIRRLSKRSESKPYIQTRKGKRGSVYTIQAEYLFDTYPRLKFDKNPIYLKAEYEQAKLTSNTTLEITALLAAKDEIIQYLKNETSYLRNENSLLQKELSELKLRVDNTNTVRWPKKMMDWAAGFWHTVARTKQQTKVYDELG